MPTHVLRPVDHDRAPPRPPGPQINLSPEPGPAGADIAVVCRIRRPVSLAPNGPLKLRQVEPYSATAARKVGFVNELSASVHSRRYFLQSADARCAKLSALRATRVQIIDFSEESDPATTEASLAAVRVADFPAAVLIANREVLENPAFSLATQAVSLVVVPLADADGFLAPVDRGSMWPRLCALRRIIEQATPAVRFVGLNGTNVGYVYDPETTETFLPMNVPGDDPPIDFDNPVRRVTFAVTLGIALYGLRAQMRHAIRYAEVISRLTGNRGQSAVPIEDV